MALFELVNKIYSTDKWYTSIHSGLKYEKMGFRETILLASKSKAKINNQYIKKNFELISPEEDI